MSRGEYIRKDWNVFLAGIGGLVEGGGGGLLEASRWEIGG